MRRCAGSSDESADAVRGQEHRSSAERQRRWRARQRSGRFIVRVEICGQLLDRLIARRLLTDAEAYDGDLLALRLAALLEALSRNR